MYRNFLVVFAVLLFRFLGAQNYQAINGSMYAGSLAPSSNPAGIVHVPYAWDITPFAFQIKQSTNAYRIDNFSFLSSPKNAEAVALNGTKKRFVFANQDLRLLNTRISLNTNAAIAFGANLRNYLYTTTSNANWQDTSFTLANFLSINTGNLPLSAEAAGSMWAEFYGSYAQTVYTDGDKILNAGITLKYNRAVAGGHGRASNVSYIPFPADKPAYSVTTGSLLYGYSTNFDGLDSNKTFNENKKTFLQNHHYSLGADIGFEYIVLADEDFNNGNEEIDEYAYKTKIGISLMDLGSNKFAYSSRSSLAIAGLPGITDTLLENKFEGVNSIDKFNDSLQTVSGSFTRLTGDFYIYQPTRIIINADQHIAGNFFINAELTIPLMPIVSKNSLFIRDMNLLALTPRWETKNLGFYFPLLFNNKKQFWAGAAFKLGPVLLGTHHIGNLFAKNTTHSGGLYLACTIRAGKKYDRQANYPGKKMSSKEKRSLECTSF